MNYDGPSFYKKREPSKQDKNSEDIETPLERLKKERNKRSQIARETVSTPKTIEPQSNNHYFRSTVIPRSLQNRDGWKKETWDRTLLVELEKRLKKEPEDYLLFSDNLIEDVLEEEIVESSGNKSEDSSDEAMKIKKMVAEIENTLDTVALVKNEIKPDLKKPNTGLHRTLSSIIAEDQTGLENGKNNLGSLFSDKRK